MRSLELLENMCIMDESKVAERNCERKFPQLRHVITMDAIRETRSSLNGSCNKHNEGCAVWKL
jgi:hypothetical protein